MILKNKLETKRLILRHFVENDAFDMFNNWASDPEVSKFLTWNPHKSVEETKELIKYWIGEYSNEKTIRFGIELKSTGELIGAIDVVGYIDEKPVIGYCLSKKYWGNKYMTEACNSFVLYLFDLGYKEILVEAIVENYASNRVIGKCGFEFTHQETKPHSRFKSDLITVNWYRKTELIKTQNQKVKSSKKTSDFLILKEKGNNNKGNENICDRHIDGA